MIVASEQDTGFEIGIDMLALRENDIVFQNVSIIDGSGVEQRYLASAVVRNGLIAAIDKSDSFTEQSNIATAKCRVIDGECGRWCLVPGFIDMHAHSDLSLLHTPDHLAKVTQGVTAEVIGQDGLSYSPVDDATMDKIRHQIAGWNGNPSEPKDFFRRWHTVKEYLDTLDRGLDGGGIATNVAYLVPQGNLRILTVGYENRSATQQEIDRMKDLLTQALEDGAVGMSSGLTYVPGMFADNGELAQLCKVIKAYDGYYSPHHRSYGRGAMEAYEEMINLARVTGVRLHLTHATLNFAENKGRAEELLTMIDAAIDDGVTITLDTYPYLPGSTTLSALLPSWVSSSSQKFELLSDPEQLAKIRHECLVVGTDGCHGCTIEWETIEISGVQNDDLVKECVGKRISEIASTRGEEPFGIFVTILKEDNFATTIIQHVGNEENVRRIMRHPKHTGGSDGILTSTKPHPRAWGTFPRYLGHYARDLKQGLSRNIYREEKDGEAQIVEAENIFEGGLEEAVSHLTFRAAQVLKLKDRGLVEVGYHADLVLFDPNTIRDLATFPCPQQAAQGIRTVLINGQFVVDEGRPTGARAGSTIRMRREQDGHGWEVL